MKKIELDFDLFSFSVNEFWGFTICNIYNYAIGDRALLAFKKTTSHWFFSLLFLTLEIKRK